MHFTINDNSKETHITALSSTGAPNMISSDRSIHITIIGSDCSTNEINLSTAYTSIEYLNEKLDKLIAVPLKKAEFQILTLTQGKHVQITTTIQTPHLLKYFQIQVYPTYFMTFGIDGLVNIWESDTLQIITSFFSHNKLFGGVRKCVSDASLRFFS